MLFRSHQFFGRIKRRRSTTVIHRHRRNIGKQFLCQTDDLLEIQVSPHKEYHIPRMIETGSKRSGIFAVKGLQQLIHTIAMVKKRLNRQLVFEGILLTMVDFRTNYAKDVAGKVREAYGEKIEIFDTVIPMSVKAAETSAEGVSIFSHCLNGKVAKAYETIAKEVLGNEE